MPGTALVFGGAPLVATPRLSARLAALRPPLAVIAADRGATTALRLGFVPGLVVGDFDSIDPASLAELEARVPIETYPVAKDATDGQLAIERALRDHQPDDLVLVGFLGGPRLDHELANVLLLTRLPVPAVLMDGANECRALRSGQAWDWPAEPGELVSLLPLTGLAQGVSTSGLRWALDREDLALGDTRGVSNEPVAEQVRVSLGSGLLLVTRHFAR